MNKTELEALEPGNLVRLNSGGPLLTVAAIVGEEVHVRWMNEGHASGGHFGFQCLRMESDSQADGFKE